MKNIDTHKKDAVIRMKTLQNVDGEIIPVELTTTGKVYTRNNKTYITYKESELTGLKGTTTTVKADDNKVVIKRFGTFPSIMIFEKGERHHNIYETQMGALSVSTLTKEIYNDLEKDRPELKIIYDMEFNNSFVSINEINIKIEENKNAGDKS